MFRPKLIELSFRWIKLFDRLSCETHFLVSLFASLTSAGGVSKTETIAPGMLRPSKENIFWLSWDEKFSFGEGKTVGQHAFFSADLQISPVHDFQLRNGHMTDTIDATFYNGKQVSMNNIFKIKIQHLNIVEPSWIFRTKRLYKEPNSLIAKSNELCGPISCSLN